MIELEEITSLPRNFTEELCPQALREFRQSGLMSFGAAKLAEKAWRISVDGTTIMYAMVYRGNLFGTPELGLYLTKAFVKKPVAAIKAAKELRTTLRNMFPKVKAHVMVDHPEGLRFAKFFDFRVVCKTNEFYLLEG